MDLLNLQNELQLVKTNKVIKKIFNNLVWDIPNSENKIYRKLLMIFNSKCYRMGFRCFKIGKIKQHFALVITLKTSRNLQTENTNGRTPNRNHIQSLKQIWKTKTNYYIENFKL